MKTRIMYIESKGDGLTGPARIGWVTFSKTGATVRYAGREYRSLKGHGFKANYFDVETGEQYWISGCKRDGTDRLYGERLPRDRSASRCHAEKVGRLSWNERTPCMPDWPVACLDRERSGRRGTGRTPCTHSG